MKNLIDELLFRSRAEVLVAGPYSNPNLTLCIRDGNSPPLVAYERPISLADQMRNKESECGQ